MGSPKAAKSRASHGGIWRRKISAPFAVIVVAAVLVLVAFTGQFAHGPDGQSLPLWVLSSLNVDLVLFSLRVLFLLGISFQLPRDSLRCMWTTAPSGEYPQIKARGSNSCGFTVHFDCSCLVHPYLVSADPLRYIQAWKHRIRLSYKGRGVTTRKLVSIDREKMWSFPLLTEARRFRGPKVNFDGLVLEMQSLTNLPTKQPRSRNSLKRTKLPVRHCSLFPSVICRIS